MIVSVHSSVAWMQDSANTARMVVVPQFTVIPWPLAPVDAHLYCLTMYDRREPKITAVTFQ